MIKIGILGIFLSVIIFVAAMVEPQILSPLGPLFCNPGEQFSSQQYTSSYRPGETDTSDTFICQDAAGNQRDVTGSVMGPVLILYLVFLFGSIGLTIIGGQRQNRQQQAAFNGQFSQNSGQNSSRRIRNLSSSIPANDAISNMQQQATLRFGGQNISLDDLKSGYVHQPTDDGKHTLADTLRQLEDAHKQGLIDSDEYGHLRQEAMNKLV